MNHKKENNELSDSFKVASRVNKKHSEILKIIKKCCVYLTKSGYNEGEYFKESVYVDNTGKRIPYYLCTTKGYDMIAHKADSKEGVVFTAEYIDSLRDKKELISKLIFIISRLQ